MPTNAVAAPSRPPSPPKPTYAVHEYEQYNNYIEKTPMNGGLWWFDWALHRLAHTPLHTGHTISGDQIKSGKARLVNALGELHDDITEEDAVNAIKQISLHISDAAAQKVFSIMTKADKHMLYNRLDNIIKALSGYGTEPTTPTKMGDPHLDEPPDIAISDYSKYNDYIEKTPMDGSMYWFEWALYRLAHTPTQQGKEYFLCMKLINLINMSSRRLLKHYAEMAIHPLHPTK